MFAYRLNDNWQKRRGYITRLGCENYCWASVHAGSSGLYGSNIGSQVLAITGSVLVWAGWLQLVITAIAIVVVDELHRRRVRREGVPRRPLRGRINGGASH